MSLFYGYYRPIISEVVYRYLSCGDLKQGFARIKCPDCQHELLLPFSCKGRWLCPSYQQKKVVLFGEHLENNVLFPVPHRQYVFSLPIMLRIYFKYDRSLLSKLCRCAYESLLLFFRQHINLPEGLPGAALVIHTFGNYPDKFHPHVHLIVTDGLFRDPGTFYVMRPVYLKPLEEIFRAKIFKMLKDEGKTDDERIRKLSTWKHSGFNIHNGTRIEKGREALCQYIARNVFNQEHITQLEQTGKVLYRSKLQKDRDTGKENFKVYEAEECIAALTQHIPDKHFQMVRYYGWYSNKSKGLRRKDVEEKRREKKENLKTNELERLDVSDYRPKKVHPLSGGNVLKRFMNPIL